MGNLSFFAMVLLLIANTFAKTMVIHKSDGSTDRIAVADISKITFNLTTTGAISKPDLFKKVKTVFARILPNPFVTKIEYSVSEPSNVRISVISMKGQTIRTILNQRNEKGQYTTAWDATGDNGKKVSNGSYIINVETAGKSISKSLFIVQ